MKNADHNAVYRKDYLPSTYLIDEIHLIFSLKPEVTRVTAATKYYKNKNFKGKISELELNGEELDLISLSINGRPLEESEYNLTDTNLALLDPPDEFLLEITTEINPEANKALSGLYRSSNNYCTQCEAEGFRRITFYLDRPDVLTKFTTRIEADREQCPVLLSNGNKIEEGQLGNNGHYAVWHDPYPKPCYLFALVAGVLVCIEDSFITRSGREVSLQIFVEHRNRNKCEHAMVSLKKAMKWDEDVFGLEYDLDVFMIVAVDDFNMGAMENKGLNIFNSKYVLASPESATDQDYLGIESVIAHEYFHNWTGNRVTCRDWFQLSLKEGLTVFRDQEFSADLNSGAVKRISDVRILRNYQFREDAGPMAHPVRPESYVEINNFYTVTIYNKGAEVIRMLRRLIGDVNFRKGMDLYFERFDGMAVTCDDFVDAMADASDINLGQFKRWYSQSGTPVLNVTESWDDDKQKFSVTVEQSCGPTPGQDKKKPFHLPLEIGLLEPKTTNSGEIIGCINNTNHTLELTNTHHRFDFDNFTSKPVLSMLRGFTAPVKVEMDQPREELGFLMAYESDLFNKWDSAFRLSTKILLEITEMLRKEVQPQLDALYIDAFRSCLCGEDDMALTAQALTLPSDIYLAQQMKVVEPALINRAILFVRRSLADILREDFLAIFYKCHEEGNYSLSNRAMGKRSLKNCCLSFLMTRGEIDNEIVQICLDQFYRKENMTDVIASLAALSHLKGDTRGRVFKDFYRDWKNEPLVIDKWFGLQASSNLDSTLEEVKNLMLHEAFSLENPNKVRSLIGTFCSNNHHRFHHESGEGYRFLTRQILEIDKKNPQIAARLVMPLISYTNYTQKLKVQMEEQLRFILMQKKLSADVYEVVKKSIEI